MSGCGVLGDVKVKTSKGNVFSNTQCDKTESRWKESLARFQPEAIILMYGGPVGAQRLIDGNWSRPCNIDFDNRYTQELVNIVDLFSHSDALIFFPTIAYSTIGDSNTVATHKEMDCINETFRNVAAANERVGMIELASFVCPSNYCRKELNGVQLRADGLHYSDEGGRLILQWLNNQVRGHPLISKGSR